MAFYGDIRNSSKICSNKHATDHIVFCGFHQLFIGLIGDTFFPRFWLPFPMRQIRSADQFIENRKSSTLFDSISRGIIAFKATFATLFSISMNRNTGAGIYSMIIWFFASTFFLSPFVFKVDSNIYEFVKVLIEFRALSFKLT